MRDSKLTFNNENYCSLPPVKNRNPFAAKWFQKVSIGSLFLLGTFFAIGSFYSKKSTRQIASQKKQSTTDTDMSLQTLKMPSILVNFKNKKGVQMAHVSAHIGTRYSYVKNKILNNREDFNKHLLIILSGKEFQKVESRKSYFEQKIRSQMNVFLSKGKVESVVLHTERLN